jgi:branched-subunit amino acid ABC-type transport system permease component
MKKIKPFIPFLFPILIILLGLIIYRVLGYEPNVYTILINIGVAFVLAPSVKKIQKENGTEEQFRWLFYKKIWK